MLMPSVTTPQPGSRPTRLMVRCRDHDGYRDVAFMMSRDDPRLSDPRSSENWRILAEGDYEHATRTLTVDGCAYHVFSDCSLGEPSRTGTS